MIDTDKVKLAYADNVKEQLSKYSVEIRSTNTFNIREDITLDELIESHRTLRNMHKKFNEERNAAMQEAREWASADFKKNAETYDWFSRERLKAMTIGELVELLHDGCC